MCTTILHLVPHSEHLHRQSCVPHAPKLTGPCSGSIQSQGPYAVDARFWARFCGGRVSAGPSLNQCLGLLGKKGEKQPVCLTGLRGGDLRAYAVEALAWVMRMTDKRVCIVPTVGTTTLLWGRLRGRACCPAGARCCRGAAAEWWCAGWGSGGGGGGATWAAAGGGGGGSM